ncbi:MAG: phage tail protein [Ruminococcus sp.]
MINFEIEQNQINQICKNLSNIRNGAPGALKNAINNTAKEARAMLLEQAQKTYAVKKGRFNKAATIKRATGYNLTAIINIKGSPMELKDFKVSPAMVPKTYVKGRQTKAKVIASNQMKSLEINGIKAFIVRFASGHVTVAQRRGPDRLPIKTLYSSSIPKMIGDETRVFGIVAPKIQTVFNTEVQKAINKVTAKYVR